MEIVNVTPHNITMLFCNKLSTGECKGRVEGGNYKRCCFECKKGVIKTIEPSGVIVKATPVEKPYKKDAEGIEYVTTEFEPSEESKKELLELDLEYWGEAIFVGSIIAAQAFPERVVAMVPVPGYERVPLEKKLVRSDKFTVFTKN